MESSGSGAAVDRFERRHGIAFAGLAVLAALLAGRADGPVVLAVLAVAVAVLGVPHGALDPAVARFKGLWRGAGSLALFLAVYTALTLVALALWWLSPPLALAVFIAISAIHFSGDWSGRLGRAARLAAGIVIVALPAAAHTETVRAILVTIAPGEGTHAIVDGLAVAGWAGLAALGALVLREALATRAPLADVGPAALELAAIALLAVVTPPLVFFVLYFAFLHSPRHTVRTLAAMPAHGRRFAIRVAVATTLLTLVYAAIAVALLPAGVAAEPATLRIVFIGLFALTVPHMALAALPDDGLRRLRARLRRPRPRSAPSPRPPRPA